MRDQQQPTAPLQPHTASATLQPNQNELLTLAEIAGVRMKPEVMKILIELLSMNVQPSELYQMLRDIVVRSYRANRAKHSGRRSAARTVENPITPSSVSSGTSPQS